MQLEDARKLDASTQEALRHRAVRLVAEKSMTHQQAADAVGVARQTVSKWVSACRRGGPSALRSQKRGRDSAAQKVLTGQEEQRVQRMIRDKCPDQLKLPFALWTAAAVQELIEREWGKRLALSTVRLYLQRWGFTPQKPLIRAKERCPARIQRWLANEYPAIVRRAKTEGAIIYWGDETGVCNQDQIGRSYAPQGQAPVLTKTTKRFSTSMISVVSNRGELRFMVYDGALNVAHFLRFLRRLIRGRQQKLFVIVDNLKVHHAYKVQAWVARHQTALELCFLPPYAPELNPDEYLNNDLKQHLSRRPKPKDKASLVKQVRATMQALQRQPARTRSYFRAPAVRYAE